MKRSSVARFHDQIGEVRLSGQDDGMFLVEGQWCSPETTVDSHQALRIQVRLRLLSELLPEII